MVKAAMPTDEKRKILAKYLPDEPDKRDEIFKMQRRNSFMKRKGKLGKRREVYV